MTLTKENIPGRWIALYKAFVAGGSNYAGLHDKTMVDMFKQMDVLFGKKDEKPKTESKKTTKAEPPKTVETPEAPVAPVEPPKEEETPKE